MEAEAVELHAKQAGIKLVIRFPSEEGDLLKRDELISTINPPIVYQDAIDITDEIIQAMNVSGDAVASEPY